MRPRPSPRLAHRLLFVLAWLLLGLATPAPAAAQSCFMGNIGDFDFGQVELHGPTDTTLPIGFTCQSNERTTWFQACIYIAQSSPIVGIAPRWLTNNNGAQLAYDLYTDPARTQIIGSPPAGAGYAALTARVQAPAGFVKVSPTVTAYGRIPGNQSVPGTHRFQSQMGGSQLYWAFSHAGFPPSCFSGDGGTGSVTFFTSASAEVSSACRISQVSNLEFGAVGALDRPVDASAQAIVRCPRNTDWNLGLDNGANSLDGSRRMRNAAGSFVRYEMYSDPARSRRWGNTIGVDTVSGTGGGETKPQTVTVHGRVPAQPTLQAGGYSDTVTITLTY